MEFLDTLFNSITVVGIKIFSATASVVVTATAYPMPFWIGAVSGFVSYVLIRESLVLLKRHVDTKKDCI